MVAPQNANLIAEAIPGAQLLKLPGAGHLYPTDEPEADRAVLSFLSERSSPCPS
jgi:pimeloyl-ACP methyl ester carboxylesterase